MRSRLQAIVVGVVVAAVTSLAIAPGANAQSGIFGKPLTGLNGGPLGGAAAENIVEPRGRILPPQGGRPAMLEVTASIQPSWHIYSITQKPGGPIRTKIKITPSSDFQLAGEFEAVTPPTSHAEPVFNNLVVEEHTGEVVWRAPLKLSPDAAGKTIKIAGAVFAQACAESCIPPKNYPFEVIFTSTEKAPTAESKISTPRPGDQLMPGKNHEAAIGTGDSSAAAPPAAPTNAAVAMVGPYNPPRSHATLSGYVERRFIAQGEKTQLLLTVDVTPRYHVYALQDTDAGAVGYKPTLVKLLPAPGVTFGQPIPVAVATGKLPDGVPFYKGQAIWSVELQVDANAPPGPLTIEGIIGLQTCQEKINCDLPAGARFRGTLVVGPSGGRADDEPLAFSPAKYGEASPRYSAAPATDVATRPAGVGLGAVAPAAVTPGPALEVPVAPAAAPPGGEELELVELNSAGANMSLLFVVVSSLIGGVLLNLMPCVLPVIGLKVLSFASQGGQSRGRVLALNLWYAAGLMLVFLVLATLAAGAKLGLTHTNLKWGEQFSSTGFTVVMSGLVFAMALSFLGVWEIPLPGFVGTGKATELAAQEGAAGAFFKGVMSTILATPCSGPFLGPVFGFMLKQPAYITYLVFVCVGLGMASPYLLIGAFPALVRWLPRPGVWMDTFKQVMGFVLLGTVVFLMMSLKEQYMIATFATLIGVWAGCWWIGRTPLTVEWGRKIAAWTQGAIVTAIVAWCSFTALVPQPAKLPWQKFAAGAPAELAASGKTVMVDFSAEWCLTCKWNLNRAINTEDVRQLVAANGVVPLLADWTDGSPEVTEALETLRSGSIPMLAIFPANQPKKVFILRDVVTKRQVLDALAKAGPSKNLQPAMGATKSDRNGPSIAWQPFTPAAPSQLASAGKTVLVDFTADWNFTCKANSKFVINTEEVRQLFESNGIVPLLADWTDGSAEITEAMHSLKLASIPAVAIFPANHPENVVILRGVITKSQLLDALKQAGPSQPANTTLSTAQSVKPR